MKFTCELNGQQYVVDAQQVGGYTMVYIWCNSIEGTDEVAFQLYPVDPIKTVDQSQRGFLERAARIALARFQHIYRSFERINMLAYNIETYAFSEDLNLA